jgi:hypothetical protein
MDPLYNGKEMDDYENVRRQVETAWRAHSNYQREITIAQQALEAWFVTHVLNDPLIRRALACHAFTYSLHVVTGSIEEPMGPLLRMVRHPTKRGHEECATDVRTEGWDDYPKIQRAVVTATSKVGLLTVFATHTCSCPQ